MPRRATGQGTQKSSTKRTTGKGPAKTRGRQRPKQGKPKPSKRITVPNPLGQATSVWEIELLGIQEREFRDLWEKDSDRIGFNVSERTIYDRTKVIGRIVKEITLPKARMSDEE